MMTKKWLSLLLALVLALSLAAVPGCAEGNDEFVELEWYCRLDPVKQVDDDVMEVFNN